MKKFFMRSVSLVYRYAQSYTNNMLKPININGSHLPFLGTIVHNEGLNQDELSKRMLMDHSTVARMVKQLVERGYIRKVQDENDRRNYRIYSTKEAIKLKPYLERLRNGLMHAAFKGFSQDEIFQFHELLYRAQKNMCDFKRSDYQIPEEIYEQEITPEMHDYLHGKEDCICKTLSKD